MWRVLSYVLLVAVPTVALGGGWLLSARREEHGHERERRSAVERAAGAAVGAITEGLDELRDREDGRPYDVYNYYYAPEDVLAAQEAVVISPIAGPPADPRVLGYFQVDPTGEVRSPSMHADASDAFRDNGERVLALLQPPALDACRGLAHGSPEEIQQSQVAARTVRRTLPSNPVQSTGEWATQLANEIREANAGNLFEANNLQMRGRASRLERGAQTWEEVEGTSPDPTPAPDPAPARRWQPRPRPRPAPVPSSHERGKIVYTPMAWGRLGGQLALYRVVSSDGASSVQGLLLDERHLREVWLTAIAERHAGAVARVRLLAGSALQGAPSDTEADSLREPRGDSQRPAAKGSPGRPRGPSDNGGRGGREPHALDERCAVARGLGTPLEETVLCFEPRAVPAQGEAMALQLAALVGLVLLVVAGSAALLVAERRAAKLATMQREFVASVSHELRTPLTTLRMHAELLREGWVEEGSRARFYDDLVVESTRLGQLVENVLTLSRLERGRAPAPAPGDLGAAANEAAEKRRRFVELKGFTLEVDAPEARASFDRESIDAIVANLLDNAVKYGGGSAKKVGVQVRQTQERVVVWVSDHGPGIPAAETERVFEQFYRVGGDGRRGAGTGLGLALVRRLAREQGGDARIVSTGAGCTVEVWLPRTS